MSLRCIQQEISLANLKSGAVVAIVLFVVLGLLNLLFEGRAVAKLPFTPVSLVQQMSHPGLPGNDPMVFLYFFCSMSRGPNLQKLLGFAPCTRLPRRAGGSSPCPIRK